MDYNLLVNTLSIQTHSYESHLMERYIKKFLKKHDLEHMLDAYGNIYVTKGDSKLYPTMVSHIDTVHEINMNSVVKRHNDTLYSIDNTNFQRTGIGGDDKVGVFITLSCLLKFDNFKAVFFKDEEVGCVGSGQCDFTFFDNSTIVLQCDRQGMGDFVDDIYGTQLSDNTLYDDIENVLLQYDRLPASGGLTDVKSIADKNDVQVANINCGYYMPHTDDEYVNITDVKDTLEFCIDIFTITSKKRYSIKRVPKKKYKSFSLAKNTTHHNSYGHFYDDWDDNNIDEIEKDEYAKTKCNACQSMSTAFDPYTNQTYCYTCDEYETTEITTNTELYISQSSNPNITNS